MNKPKVIAIVGPTASGKTSLSIEIAKHCNGEVISADSRQIYRGMDIGTGKVTEAEMCGIPHHLIDILEPNEIFTATDFKNEATKAILEIKNRGHLPIVAGGTFFYLDVLRNKMEAAPVPPNPALREQLEKLNTEDLFDSLKIKDPARAELIDKNNRRRLIRSLEIIESLGSVPNPTNTPSPYDWLIIGIKIEKEVLRENFSKRLDGWLQAGYIEEVASLLEKGISRERLQEIGFDYTLALEFIDGKITLDELRQKFVEKNWQYAKRQIMWLKRDSEIEWFDPKDVESILKRVKTFLSN